MNVIVKHIPHTVDLNEPVKKTYIDTLLATEDNLAHRFDITIKKGGEAVTLPDGTAVTAYFIRYGENATVPITGGAVNGNVASVTLTKACYNKPGQFALIIKVSENGIINTVYYGEGTIFTSITDIIIDEEDVIPSLADLLAQIEAMETATEAAKTATTNAKSATTKANNATTSANNAATAANTAADAANAAAQNWSNGTAANAIQLNGKDAEYYATAESVNQLSQQIAGIIWESPARTLTLAPDVEIEFNIENCADPTKLIPFFAIDQSYGKAVVVTNFWKGGTTLYVRLASVSSRTWNNASIKLYCVNLGAF